MGPWGELFTFYLLAASCSRFLHRPPHFLARQDVVMDHMGEVWATFSPDPGTSRICEPNSHCSSKREFLPPFCFCFSPARLCMCFPRLVNSTTTLLQPEAQGRQLWQQNKHDGSPESIVIMTQTLQSFNFPSFSDHPLGPFSTSSI